MRERRKNINIKMQENIVLGSHVFLVTLNISDYSPTGGNTVPTRKKGNECTIKKRRI